MCLPKFEVDAYARRVEQRCWLIPACPFAHQTFLLLSAYISMSDQFVANLAWADFAITEHPYEVLHVLV